MTTPSPEPPANPERTGGPMHLSDRLVEPVLGVVAAVILFALMLLTCVDVVGRYFLSMPIYGGFELTETMLACLIFAGLPLVTLRQEHVTVDVLDALTPGWLVRVQHVVASLIGAVACGYLGWRLWIRGGNMLAAGETTAQLKIKLGYLALAMGVLMVLTAIILLVVAFRRPRLQATGEV